MNRRPTLQRHRLKLFCCAVIFSGAFPIFAATSPPLDDGVLNQIAALELEKSARSPLHRKLDSHFVLQLKSDRGEFRMTNNPGWRPRLQLEAGRRVLADIDAPVTDDLLRRIRQAGGQVVDSVPRYHSIRALLPLNQLENLAALANVAGIKRAVLARCYTGSVNSQGDTTHGANLARTNFAVSGAGLKIGVLSDSVDYLTNSQASGDLPTNLVVLAGQSGVPATGEGTAMLEIINDLAPGAQLYFATASASEAGFAQNILDLCSNGCNIIVDDVGYFDESPFQDGIVGQAVNTVTAAGALYFSACGNGGNLDQGTSSTWEGNFLDGGSVRNGSLLSQYPYQEAGARFHKFGSLNYDVVSGLHPGDVFVVTLFWADPLGASANDYDLFVLNPSGTAVYDFSGGSQSGTQDPFEACYATNGCRVVVVKYSGAARYLRVRLETDGYGILTNSTAGAITGHAMATNAFAVAATRVNLAYPNLFTTNNTVEYFSSDGPRRVFFNADGTAITPNNFTSTGGALRLKPDITAANGVATSVPGFSAFYGTSAAAPHAAALAALLWSYDPALTPAQIRFALTNTALDIGAAGFDRDAGAGIVMASSSLQSVAAQFFTPAVTSFSATNGGDPRVAWNSASNHVYQLQYTAALAPANWQNLGASITSTGGVISASDPAAADPARFYRVQLVH